MYIYYTYFVHIHIYLLELQIPINAYTYNRRFSGIRMHNYNRITHFYCIQGHEAYSLSSLVNVCTMG